MRHYSCFLALSSEFVSMRIIQELYELCCSKRFSANRVTKLVAPPRTTLYKYLIIPKEDQPRPPPQPHMQQPQTPNYENRSTMNPFEQIKTSQIFSTDQRPPEIKRRTVHTEQEGRPRSGTLPFLQQTEQLQSLSSMRSGNGSTTTRRVYHPKQDEQVEEGEEEHQQ